MRSRCFYLLLCFLVAASSATLDAAERVALVVGNNAYEHAPALANPLNDAKAVAGRLEEAGYSVTLLENAGIRDMLKGLRSFCSSAQGAETAVFFFAGHGVEVDGENYLLPVDAELQEEVDLDLETLTLADTIDEIGESGARLKLIILDCCRNNPFEATRSWVGATRSLGSGGLAAVEQDKLAEGTMLVFSAAPRKSALDGEGDNSPFSVALIREMAHSGLSIAGVFGKVAMAVSEQEPWIRFDGSGRSFAAFNSYPLIPEDIPEPTAIPAPASDLQPPEWVELDCVRLALTGRLEQALAAAEKAASDYPEYSEFVRLQSRALEGLNREEES